MRRSYLVVDDLGLTFLSISCSSFEFHFTECLSIFEGELQANPRVEEGDTGPEAVERAQRRQRRRRRRLRPSSGAAPLSQRIHSAGPAAQGTPPHRQ